jgi:hypothetical protein
VTNGSINIKQTDNIITPYEAINNFCTCEVIDETEYNIQ